MGAETVKYCESSLKLESHDALALGQSTASCMRNHVAQRTSCRHLDVRVYLDVCVCGAEAIVACVVLHSSQCGCAHRAEHGR